VKRGYVYVDEFEDILDEFPPAFDYIKPLCRKIRGIKHGALFTGAPLDLDEYCTTLSLRHLITL